MSRYIDADLVKINYIGGFKDTFEVDYDSFMNAPSINIVRCEECRYWEKLNYEAPKQGWCNDPTLYCDGRWTNANDYCSYGEREDG